MPDISICSTYSVWIRIVAILEKSSSTTSIYIKSFLKIGKYIQYVGDVYSRKKRFKTEITLNLFAEIV